MLNMIGALPGDRLDGVGHFLLHPLFGLEKELIDEQQKTRECYYNRGNPYEPTFAVGHEKTPFVNRENLYARRLVRGEYEGR